MFSKGVFSAGIDIGHSAVKLAVLDCGRMEVRLLQVSDPFPAPWNDALPPDDIVVDRLRSLAAALPYGIRTVSAAIEGEGTWCQYLELPPVAREEMQIAVKSAARKRVPFGLEASTLTYVQLDATRAPAEPGQIRIPVFAVAARRQQVERYTRWMEAAGLRLERLDLTPLALAHVLNESRPKPAAALQLLIDLGSRWTHIVLVGGGSPRFVRYFSPAVADMIAALVDASGSDWKQAEGALRRTDLRHPSGPVEVVVTRWLDEVERTINSFCAHAPDGRLRAGDRSIPSLGTILMCGGGALLSGLPERLAGRLSTPVEVAAWGGIQCHLPAAASLFQTAVGLALRK